MLTLSIWAGANLTLGMKTGLVFGQLKSSKTFIKLSLVAYLIAASYYFYDFLCVMCQKFKGFDEDEAIWYYTENGRFEGEKVAYNPDNIQVSGPTESSNDIGGFRPDEESKVPEAPLI